MLLSAGAAVTPASARSPVAAPTVRVVDGTVRIDPFVAGTSDPGRASFHRRPGRHGISLQLAGDTTLYLRHDRGRLSVGPAAGARSTVIRSRPLHPGPPPDDSGALEMPANA